MSAAVLPERSARVVGAWLTAALVAMLYYGLDRTRAAIGGEVYDPYTIISVLRVDYFWRVGISLFLGSLAAGIWWMSIRNPQQALGHLARALPFVVALVTLLSAIWP